MTLFHDVPNFNIETPIKIYIAGAAFRKINKLNIHKYIYTYKK